MQTVRQIRLPTRERPVKTGVLQRDPRAFIAANMPVAPVPTSPEIRLHRARPGSGLWRLAAADPHGFGSPYWAYAWPGGLALARHVLDRPEIVAGRRVLDLGAGSGLAGIAAARAGATQVIAAEIDRYAHAAIALNAAANRVALAVLARDVTRDAPPPAVDLVLVGDLFYAADLAAQVTAFLDRCVDRGIAVLIGDIGRAFLPRSRLRRVAEYPVPEFGEAPDGPNRSCGVFAFQPEAS